MNLKLVLVTCLALFIIPTAFAANTTIDSLIDSFDYSYSNGSISIISKNDFMQDKNADNLNDTLVVNLTTSSVDGTFTFIVTLLDKSKIFINTTTKVISSSDVNAQINFPTELLEAKKFNYTLEILNVNKELVYREYKTETNTYQRYDNGSAIKRITNENIGNNFIRINLTINSTKAITSNVTVTLAYNQSSISAKKQASLINGTQVVSVDFDNETIKGTHYNSNFTIDSIVIGTKIFDFNQNISTYNYETFAKTSYIQSVKDKKIDLNANSLSDYLELNFTIVVKGNDNYTLSYDLYDQFDNYVASKNVTQTLSTGTQRVQTLINGSEIYKTKIRGPYVIKFAKLDIRNITQDILFDAHITNDSSYADYERPPLPDLKVALSVQFNATTNITNISVNVSNIGNISALNVYLDIFDNRTFNNNRSISQLDKNTTINYKFNVTGSTLASLYTAIADFDNVVDETDETNNIAQNTLADAPSFSNTTIGPSSPTTWSSSLRIFFNVTVADNDGISKVYLTFNNVNYTMFNKSNRYHYNVSSLSAGVYSYSFWANDTLGNKNQLSSSSYILSKATPGISIQVTGPTTYQPNANTTGTGSGCPTGVTCTLYFNKTAQANPYKAILAAGVYNFTYNTTGNQNYSNSTVSSLRTIAKNTSQVLVWVDLARLNKTMYPGTSIWLNATKQLGEGNIQLYRNNTLINTGSSQLNNFSLFSNLGLYNITAKYPATQNYTETSSILFVNVTKQPGLRINLVYPTTNINVTQNSKFNIAVNVTCTSSICLDVNVSLDPIAPSEPIQIGVGNKEWTFTQTQSDSLVDAIIEPIESNKFQITVKQKQGVNIPSNYAWHVAVCDNEEIDSLAVIDSKGTQSKTEETLSSKGISSSWCPDSNGVGYILSSNMKAADFNKPIIFELTGNASNFRLYAGSASVIIDALATSTSTANGQENICIDNNGILHVAWEDSAGLWYGNSSNDGASWSTKQIRSATVSEVGILCAPDNSIIIHYLESDDLDMFKSTNSGANFTGPTTIEDSDTFHYPSCAMDSNNIAHCCLIDATNDLWYANTSILNNGTEISAADSGECDIEVDSNNNAYILAADVTTDDLTILSSKDGYSTRNTFGAGTVIFNSNRYIPSIAICNNGTIYTASIDNDQLKFCEGNVQSWTAAASCQIIDTDNSYFPDIAASSSCNPYILYSATSTFGDIVLANRTKGGSFEIRKTLQSSAQYPNIADSRWSSSNRMSDTLHYTYTYDTFDFQVQYDNLAIFGSNTGQKGGLVSTVAGATPFFTNSSNPTNTTILGGQSKLIIWWVNATGSKLSYEFFAFANLTHNLSINNVTTRINITII